MMANQLEALKHFVSARCLIDDSTGRGGRGRTMVVNGARIAPFMAHLCG